MHRIGDRPIAELEAELRSWSADTPMAIIIPTLYDELERRALPTIVNELAEVPYLGEVIIGVDGADAEQFAEARRFFATLPMRHRLLWNDGPRLRAVDDELRKLDLAPTQQGKGRNVWYCLGYFLASGRSDVVALHDADILTYSRDLPARLLYPVAHPDFGYAFAKGYYYRTDGMTLNGRVARLFVAPMIRALRSVLGPSDYLEYLAAFRYPLAGEFALRREVVGGLRIPADWGVEIGILGEVHRRNTVNRICQVDIANAYDHKHQPLSADDPTDGLHRMAIDIALTLYRRLALDGAVWEPPVFRTLQAAFSGAALDLVLAYHHDAELNGLATNRHLEEETVEVFARAVTEAGDAYLADPLGSTLVPDWDRVRGAVPDVLDRLAEAVQLDNQD